MKPLDVDGLTFVFPDGWTAQKYDEWSFYRNQLVRVRDGIKAIDVLAMAPDHVAWFIEAKDYRVNQRTKPSALPDEVSRKVLDTLAALLPARLNATVPEEQDLASALLAAKGLRVVLHLEQPRKHSRLRPRAIDPAAVKQQLKRLLKPIDAHPVVSETHAMGSLAWRVE